MKLSSKSFFIKSVSTALSAFTIFSVPSVAECSKGNNSNKETNYILFAILFGCFGVHNFYIGKTKRATIQLLLTLCSCFILSIPVSIWAMVEAFNYEEEINK